MVSGLLGDCRSAALQGHAGVSGGAGQGGLCGVWRRAVGLGGTVRPELGAGGSVTVVQGGSCAAISPEAFFPPFFFFFFLPSNLLICITK